MWNIIPCSKIIDELENKIKYDKFCINLNKIRYPKIKARNILLNNTSKIQKNKSKKNLSTNWKKMNKSHIKHSFDKIKIFRDQKLSICQERLLKKENSIILKKINSVKSYYNSKYHNMHYIKHLNYKKNISLNARRLWKVQTTKPILPIKHIKKKLLFKK